jgi:UDP-2,4-diacetamido-2,4,6-trideoxy-beta-L-altropyranose hydrolase
MKIAFRVDASSTIGTGHLMRCLTLADEMKQCGVYTCFISRHMPEYLRDILGAKGHVFTLLNSSSNTMVVSDLAHAAWLETSQESDAQDALYALSDQLWDWIVVDHYALDARWESALRQTARQILVIDDLADRKHDCDVLLDQNFYADMNTRYTGKVPEHCLLLLGPRYALLREEFRQLREQVRPRKGSVQRILIFFGGVDASNYTGLAIQALIAIGLPDIHVDVVIGASHPCRESIEEVCNRCHFTYYVQTERMAELMAAADLSIGAGGSATWERCCLGLPTITICTADNQREQITDAASEGLLYAPEVNDEFDLMIKRHVRSLMENSCLRQLISRNGMQSVNGRGALRVIGSMGCCNGVAIRTAILDDLESLFIWRNHPTIRAVSRNTDAIKWEDHRHWFASVLSDPNRLLLIGECEEVPIGVVRFDIRDHEAEISIYLVPDAKTSARGRDLLQSAEQWCSFNLPAVSTLRAHVLGANERSQHLFLAAGYDVESTYYLKRIH